MSPAASQELAVDANIRHAYGATLQRAGRGNSRTFKNRYFICAVLVQSSPTVGRPRIDARRHQHLRKLLPSANLPPHLSLALASRIVFHCKFQTASGPPQARGMT